MNQRPIIVTHPEASRPRGAFFLYIAPDESRQLFTGASVCRVIETPRRP